MEGLPKKISVEQQEQDNKSGELLAVERQEDEKKFRELLEIMISLPDTFKDSNDAYEVKTSIDDFKKEFETGDQELKKYLLGGVLLSSEGNFDTPDYPKFDTDNDDIEKFIRGLQEQRQEKIAA
ncbi:MAG: hypothetical protein ABIF22_03150 [bacterium]